MQLCTEALKNFKQNYKKDFFYDLDQFYTGRDCLQSLSEKIAFLNKLNIQNIAINIPNSFEWVMWYLAADNICCNIFLISTDFESNVVKTIIENNSIQLLVQKNAETVLIKNKGDIALCKNKRRDIIFTSGTTAKPKGVIIGEESFLHVANALIKETNQNQNDLELLSMPFDRSFGLARLRACILAGCSALVVNGLKSFPDIYMFSKNNKITGLSLVPSALQIIILQLRKKAKEFTKDIRYLELGSSALIEGQFDWIKANLNQSSVIHHYGMTESSRAFIKRLHMYDEFQTSVGKKLEGVEYKILKLNQDSSHGELLLKGKNLFSGYLDKEQTKKAFKNEWYHTGDICYEDKDEIFLVGRSDNQMNIGGAKVQAEQVEKLIENLSCVNDSLCFEFPDKVLGNTIGAFIETDEDILKIKECMKVIFKSHPSYYTPGKIKIVDSIPKTFNGKKQRDTKELMRIFK